MGAVFDQKQLERWEADTRRFIAREYPKETKKFMNDEGKIAKNYLRKATQRKTTRRTGNLLKGIDKKAAKKTADTYQVEIRNRAPHAWLVEHGHNMVVWGNRTDKRVEGRFPAGLAEKTMRKRFPKDADEFVDRMLKEICR